VLYIYVRPGDVAEQFIPTSPTCPGDTFMFRCTVVGNVSGITTWRVGGTSECPLVHGSLSTAICGPDNAKLTARAETGFGPGTSATSFSSTLSGTATPALNGTLVECFGPANNVDQGNRIGSSTLQIKGMTILLVTALGLLCVLQYTMQDFKLTKILYWLFKHATLNFDGKAQRF